MCVCVFCFSSGIISFFVCTCLCICLDLRFSMFLFRTVPLSLCFVCVFMLGCVFLISLYPWRGEMLFVSCLCSLLMMGTFSCLPSCATGMGFSDRKLQCTVSIPGGPRRRSYSLFQSQVRGASAHSVSVFPVSRPFFVPEYSRLFSQTPSSFGLPNKGWRILCRQLSLPRARKSEVDLKAFSRP